MVTETQVDLGADIIDIRDIIARVMEGYARETAEDIYGDELRSAHWPFTFIDWDAATEAFKQDYTSAEINGVEY